MSTRDPILMSVADANAYLGGNLGGISHTHFYVVIMPHLQTVKIGRRRMIFIASIDRYVESRR